MPPGRLERWRIQHKKVFPAALSHPRGAKRKVVSLQSTGWKRKVVQSGVSSCLLVGTGGVTLGKRSKLAWPRPWAAWSNFEDVKSNIEASSGLSTKSGQMSSRGPLQLYLFCVSRSSSQCRGIKARTGLLMFFLGFIVLGFCFLVFCFWVLFFYISIAMTTIMRLFSRIK